jgi:SPP1 gp7 family putative phage head morphogenesis protein
VGFFSGSPGIAPGHLKIDHKALKSQLSGLYPITEQSFPNLLSDAELEKIIEKLLRNIFKNRSIANVSKKMMNYFIDQLMQAVYEGYGYEIGELEPDTLDYDILKALQANVIRFSAAKDDAMNRAIRNELTDATGNIRSFSEFKKFAYAITTDHTQAWLSAEYNFAIASAQMNSKWQQIVANSDALPLLQYETVGDDRVRPAHRELEGITRPYDDLFWDIYFPPNGWRCRCTVRQLQDGVVTPPDKIITPETMPKMFMINFGKQNLVFPPNHPYYGK